jgi:hypothetical protein
MAPNGIDRVVRKYAAALGLYRVYSATFTMSALENGAQLEDVQNAGHGTPNTRKLCHRRDYNPKKAARLFATC